ncbi:hypothetical protein K1719_015516 [Acacia pycnantha]|nr:hypothetical protein K1719_015516 [Acacia pycnantha]
MDLDNIECVSSLHGLDEDEIQCHSLHPHPHLHSEFSSTKPRNGGTNNDSLECPMRTNSMTQVLRLLLHAALPNQNRTKPPKQISVSNHIDAFQYKPRKYDSFVIDMDVFSSTINKDNSPNSRITAPEPCSEPPSKPLRRRNLTHPPPPTLSLACRSTRSACGNSEPPSQHWNSTTLSVVSLLPVS